MTTRPLASIQMWPARRESPAKPTPAGTGNVISFPARAGKDVPAAGAILVTGRLAGRK
jgi:hypothetical protein